MVEDRVRISICFFLIFSFTKTTRKVMRTVNGLLRQSQRFIKRNASTILTTIGGAGVIVTAVMAVKATPKALQLIEQAEVEKGEKLTKIETVKTAGVVYIPAVITGTATIACVFGANILNKRQQAALMSAYALLDNSYKEYKAKTVELYGEDADGKVKEEIAKDKYKETDIPDEDDKMLFYDEFSKQYFRSTMIDVQNAEYYINRDLVMSDYALLNDFYDYLGIPHHPAGDELGWSSAMNFDYYWQTWIDFVHKTITMDDGTECCVITMYSEPSVGWDDYA